MDNKDPIDNVLQSSLNKVDRYKNLKGIIKMAFEYYDRDNSGFLDMKEITELLKDICEALQLPDLTPQRIKEIFEKLDENGDNQITVDEIFAQIGEINNIIMSSLQKDNGDFPIIDNSYIDKENEHYIDNPNFIQGLGRQIILYKKLNEAANKSMLLPEKLRDSKRSHRRFRKPNDKFLKKDVFIPIVNLVNHNKSLDKPIIQITNEKNQEFEINIENNIKKDQDFSKSRRTSIFD